MYYFNAILQQQCCESLLSKHPDRDYLDHILTRIKEGFRVGFEDVALLSSARRNMQSAMENSQVVSEYLAAEISRGVLLGLDRSEVPEVHLNRLGVIPKSSQPGKWRLIVDLSHPEGKSVNDSILPDLCSLHYVCVDDVV